MARSEAVAPAALKKDAISLANKVPLQKKGIYTSKQLDFEIRPLTALLGGSGRSGNESVAQLSAGGSGSASDKKSGINTARRHYQNDTRRGL
jgi:hypothetical protein